MKMEELEKSLKECFEIAERDEKKGKKHKGLLIENPDHKVAQEYIQKAKMELELCEIYKQKGIDYKIAEEWFYTTVLLLSLPSLVLKQEVKNALHYS